MVARRGASSLSRSAANRIVRIPRSLKHLITLAADGLMIPLALWVAISLKFGYPELPRDATMTVLVAVLAAIPVFVRLGLYRSVIRFLGARALAAVAAGIAASAFALGILGWLAGLRSLSPSVLTIYAALALLYVGVSRFTVRYYLLSHTVRETVSRVAIYGAGEIGARLSMVLTTTRALDPVVFVDDNPQLDGRLVNGIPVVLPSRLKEVVRAQGIDRVLIAIPSLSRRRMHEIVAFLEPLAVHVQTVPEFEQLVSGIASIGDLRNVDVADLLGRDPVPPLDDLFDACIRDRVVMVTGAGGSIGSELCRQIIERRPSRLILFEMSEYALYKLERELDARKTRTGVAVELVAIIGNAHHRPRVREILETYRVDTLYHAAAYKHVPLVERNVVEGIHNNVIATWQVAEAAHEAGVKTFVLISSDKAVNPTNVMGATKRLAEIVLQGLQLRGSGTRYCMVRFGNVLGSSGSVVPLFKEQIQSGGPVTVTHPDVVRFFMTIPEAVQLVIQAGSMGEGGDVFLLDMGEPVRIYDLARRMIHLSGLNVRDAANPDGDIEIVFTGLRPGEKLFEELLIGKAVGNTRHPKILRAREHALPWNRVKATVDDRSRPAEWCKSVGI